MGGRGRGRPKGSKGTKRVSKALGHSKSQCAVCHLIKRADKIKEHQVSSVLFDASGEPVGEDHPGYISLTEDKRKHTDFFRENKYNRLNLPRNKIIVNELPGNITSFFVKRQRLENNNDDTNNDSDCELEDDHILEDGDTIHSVDGLEMVTNVNCEVNEFDMNENSLDENCAMNNTEEDNVNTIFPPPRSNIFNEEEDEIEDNSYSLEEDENEESVSVELDPNSRTEESINSNDNSLDQEKVTEPSEINPDKLIEDLTKSITSQFGSLIEVQSLGNISKVIAARVVEKLEEKKRRDTVLEDSESMWREDESGEQIFCLCCSRYGSDPNVPQNVRKYNHGNFGIFKKVNPRGRNLFGTLANHTKNLLHIWCLNRYKIKQQEEESFNKKNEKACSMIVTNAAFVLKDPAGSAKTFVELNNKDQLLMGENYPTKNDGKQYYFELRSIFFNKLSQKMKATILKVNKIAISLDKVTLDVPYTVICTYYFWKGRLKVFLNELCMFQSDFYDGEGSARMVCESLYRTLGVDREDLVEKLEHLSIDGVYVDQVERIRGGGSLSLTEHLTEHLGLGTDSKLITNSWDLGHRIQLVLGDILKNKKVNTLNSIKRLCQQCLV